MTDPTDDPDPEEEQFTTAEELTENDITHVELTFHPQCWETHYGEDKAVRAGESISFIIPVEDVLDDQGELIPERTREMDTLKDHENAPSGVKCWSGPFEIYYGDFYSQPKDSESVVRDTALAVVAFHPQVPVNGDLVEVDDTWTFTVPAEMALAEDGSVIGDDTDASDHLATYEHAPEIVRRWTKLTDWYYRITIDAFRVAGTNLSPETFERKYGQGSHD